MAPRQQSLHIITPSQRSPDHLYQTVNSLDEDIYDSRFLVGLLGFWRDQQENVSFRTWNEGEGDNVEDHDSDSQITPPKAVINGSSHSSSFRHSKPLATASGAPQHSLLTSPLRPGMNTHSVFTDTGSPSASHNAHIGKNVTRVTHNHAVLRRLRDTPSRVLSLSPAASAKYSPTREPAIQITEAPQSLSPSQYDEPVQRTLANKGLVDAIIQQHFQSSISPTRSQHKDRRRGDRQHTDLLSPSQSGKKRKFSASPNPSGPPTSRNDSLNDSEQSHSNPNPTSTAVAGQLRKNLQFNDPTTNLPTQSMLPSAIISGDLTFLLNMPSYGPLIKFLLAEYESAIEFVREYKRHNCPRIEDLQAQIQLTEKQCDAQIANLSEEFDAQLSQLQAENDALQEKLNVNANDEYLRELRYKYESLCMQRQEIKSEIEREKINSKNLYEAVKFSRENEQRLREQIEQKEKENKEIEMYREHYMSTLVQLNNMPEMVHEDEYNNEKEREANYKIQQRILTQKLEQEQVIAMRLKEQIQKLKQAPTLELDRDAVLKEEKRAIKRTHTPQPSWNGLKQVFDSVEVREILQRAHTFPELDITQSSRDIVSQVAEYIKASHTVEKCQASEIASLSEVIKLLDPSMHNKNNAQLNEIKEFQGLGTGPEVPKYLRITGSVRNKQLSKRELENLLEDVWKQRLRSLAVNAKKKPIPFGDFFETYLSTQFSNVLQVKREWAYSIVEGCKLFVDDPDCALFLMILNGKIAEEAYEGQDKLLENLKQLMEKLGQKESGICTGKIKKRDVFQRLDRFFRTKSKHNLLIIKCMLHYQNPESVVDYEKLFQDDRNHTQGIFVEVVRDQYVQEIIEYNEQLEERIMALSDEMTNTITFKKIHEAFFAIDPLKTKAQVEDLIQRALSLTEPIKWKAHVDADRIVQALHKILILRSTPVDDVEAVKEKLLKRKKETEKKKLADGSTEHKKSTGAKREPK